MQNAMFVRTVHPLLPILHSFTHNMPQLNPGNLNIELSEPGKRPRSFGLELVLITPYLHTNTLVWTRRRITQSARVETPRTRLNRILFA